MNGGIRLLEEKVHLFSLPESQVIDFAILSDVIKLQRRNYSSPERWWSRVVEDAQRIRSGYLQYSDDEIIKGGDRIHLNIAAAIKEYLISYFGFN